MLVLALENAAVVSDVGDGTEEPEDGIGQAVITCFLAKDPSQRCHVTYKKGIRERQSHGSPCLSSLCSLHSYPIPPSD